MNQLPGQGRSSVSRRALRPLRIVRRTPAASGSTLRRSTAAEASRAARRGRNNTPSARPRSAASCRRRMSRGFTCRTQPSTASQAPEPRVCSRAHTPGSPRNRASCRALEVVGSGERDFEGWPMPGSPRNRASCRRAPATTATRSSTTPQETSAGANGTSGGATHTHQRAAAARVSAPSAGTSSVSSPLPKRETKISIRPVRGQPLSGRYSSSVANPVGNPDRCAALRPRQIAGCSSSRAIFGSPTTIPAHERMSSHQAAGTTASHHTHDDPFDEQGLLFQIHSDRLELAVLGQQPHDRAFLAVAFHGDLVLEPCDHDLPTAHFRGAMYRDQVPVEDSDILHAHADHLQQVMRPWLEHSRIDLQPRLEIFLRKDGLAGGHPPDERQTHLLPDGVLQLYPP